MSERPGGAAPASSIDVSVIVPAHNAETGVVRLLEALDAQTLARERFEVLIADDCSTDATADVVAGSELATLIRSERRGGSYVARNRALERARGAVIAFTDADCRPDASWLATGLDELDGLQADLLGGRVAAQLSATPSLAELLDFARGIDQHRQVTEWGFAATANLFVRRAVLERIGAFNPALISGGDKEISMRAVGAGFTLRYSENAVVHHALRSRAREMARKYFRVGFGLGQIARLGRGPARDDPRVWPHLYSYRPRRGLMGIEHLEVVGYELSRGQSFRLDLAQYACCQLPMALGDLVAELRRGRPALR